MAAVVVVVFAGAGCISSGSVRCLSGATPSVGRPVPDEMFGLMRRELKRAERSSPLVRARILETLPRMFPDVSDMRNEPTCAPELVARAKKHVFARSPVEFSRLAVARVRMVGAVGDTTDVMKQKAAFLLRVARLRDEQIAAYRKLKGERGPVPKKSLLRQLAIANLGWSSLRDNVRSVRPFLRKRRDTTTDPVEKSMLDGLFGRTMRNPHAALRSALPPAQPSRAEVMARVHDLDGELTRLHYSPARCHVLAQLGAWLPGDLAAGRFAKLVAPIFKRNKVWLRSETLCRIRVALALDQMAAAPRIQLLRRLVAVRAADVTKYDFGGDEAHPGIAYDTNPMTVRVAAAAALATHPQWVEQDAGLRALLETAAAMPLANAHSGDAEHARQLLQPAIERLLVFYAASRGAAIDRGRAIMRGLTAEVAGVLDGAFPRSLYGYLSLRSNIETLRRHAAAYNMTDQVNALLARIRKTWAAPKSLPVAERVRKQLIDAAKVK